MSEDPWRFYTRRQNRQKDWAEGVRRPDEPDMARRSYAREAVWDRDAPEIEISDETRDQLRALLRADREQSLRELRGLGDNCFD